MAQQYVNTGTVGNDGTGDDLRTGATKINQNFTDVYSQLTAISLAITPSSTNSNGIAFGNDGILFDGATKDSHTTVTKLVPADPSGVNVITMQDSSGILAFTSDITRTVNRSYILGIKGAGSTLLDSASMIDAAFARGFIDSARMARISLDSADVTSYIDATYIQLRQKNFIDSAELLKVAMTQPQVDSSIAAHPDVLRNRVDIGTLQVSVGDVVTQGTTVIPEGSNLYYTVARANTAIDARVDKAFVDALNVDADTLDGVDYTTIDNAINALPDSAQVATIVADEMAAISYDLLPDIDSTRDLGSPTKKWKDLHLSGNTIFLGGGTISYNNNEYNFGAGSIKTENAIAMDSGQRLFFANAGANITSTSNPQPNSLSVNANTLSLATVDDASTGWYVKTNLAFNGAFSTMGNAGLVMLPQNTATNRTQYQTNPTYANDYRAGAIHYSTTTNQVEMSDNTGWFPVHRNNAAVAYFTFGLDAATSSASNQDLFTTNGASPTNGYVMPVDGAVTNITARFTSSSYGGSSSTFLLDIDVNGTTVQSKSIEVTGNGTQTLNQTCNVPYNSGDAVSVALTQDAGHTASNTAVILRIQED